MSEKHAFWTPDSSFSDTKRFFQTPVFPLFRYLCDVNLRGLIQEVINFIQYPQVAGEHTVLSARITFPLQLAYVFLRGLHHPFLFGSHIPKFSIINCKLSIR